MTENHLDEETLNMLLDGELSAQERRRADAHLATCPACRAERRALQSLFAALDKMAPETAPDLVPGVLAQVQPGRRFRPSWLLPALQGLCALAFLAQGWARLAGYWATVAGSLSPAPLEGAPARALAWVTAQWTAISAWPTVTWRTLRQWSDWLPGLGGGRLASLSPGQAALWAVPLAALWLLGNAVVLHRARLNGRT